MNIQPVRILQEIEYFLSVTGMGESYFGKRSVGNSEVVKRLRKGGRIWPETEIRILRFMSEVKKDKAMSQ